MLERKGRIVRTSREPSGQVNGVSLGSSRDSSWLQRRKDKTCVHRGWDAKCQQVPEMGFQQMHHLLSATARGYVVGEEDRGSHAGAEELTVSEEEV